MFYYKIALLKSSAPLLTYHSLIQLEVGFLVEVSLKTTQKEGVILEEVQKPEFQTSPISQVFEFFYSKMQVDIASFIAYYYFSSIGEALALFTPFKKNISIEQSLKASITSPSLTQPQQKAYEALKNEEIALLFGVTGSGKTEIFISRMIDVLKEGKQVIFLMPEISLTPQMQNRLEKYFGSRVAMWHSKLTPKAKKQILEDIYSGKVDIIAGARSALFVPFERVGLIVVDEEHDDSYKSSQSPRYHARDMAIYMAKKFDAKVILASATPSLTSYHRFSVVRLKEPFIQTSKSYRFIKGSTLTQGVIKEIESNFQNGLQSLVFIPTRGNFKYLYCQNCGKTHTCPYCSVGMTLHRNEKYLKCHYCNYTEALRDSCVECGYTPLISHRIGTAEVKELIEENIEGLVVEQFDTDSISTHKKLLQALSRFSKNESHLLLGTQMLSKGHDYADISLSVIMGLDYIYGLSDYRARAKALSLLIQIAGRSGRARDAKIIIQTANEAFFKKYMLDYELFLKDELPFMEDFYPPFVSLARVLISHKEDTKAKEIMLGCLKKLEEINSVEIVGHGKAPIERVASKFRYQILLSSNDRVLLLKTLWQINTPLIQIDMDAIDFT
ncbi:MAG: primosomal protein N' [Epsilonproteobacteria bacterium]|nr:primosomal protein N' [Campylobacterota bacterium]